MAQIGKLKGIHGSRENISNKKPRLPAHLQVASRQQLTPAVADVILDIEAAVNKHAADPASEILAIHDFFCHVLEGMYAPLEIAFM